MPRKNKFKYNPIDFVPRRRPGEVIQAETNVERMKAMNNAPGRVGQNRAELIENLQERNQFENK